IWQMPTDCSNPCQAPDVARVGRIDRSVERSPCALRCRRTDARKIVVAASIALDTSPSMEGMRVDDGAAAEATSQHTWCLTTARNTTWPCDSSRTRTNGLL